MNYGENVRKLREERQLTQAEFAEKLGCTQTYLCHVERGRKKLSADMIRAISEEYNVPTDRIYFGKSS